MLGKHSYTLYEIREGFPEEEKLEMGLEVCVGVC